MINMSTSQLKQKRTKTKARTAFTISNGKLPLATHLLLKVKSNHEKKARVQCLSKSNKLLDDPVINRIEFNNNGYNNCNSLLLLKTPNTTDIATARAQIQQQTTPYKIRNTTLSTTDSTILHKDNIPTILNCCHDANCKLNMASIPTCSRPLEKESIAKENFKRKLSKPNSHTHTQSLEFSLNTTQTIVQEGEDIHNKSQKQLQFENNSLRSSWWCSLSIHNYVQRLSSTELVLQIQLDTCNLLLFFIAFCTRFYRLNAPSYVVFDELHYGKYISHYVRNTFFFDNHPPLGKQLIAALVGSVGYNGNFTVSHVGSKYPGNVPIFWFRFIPALCGSLLPVATYNLLLESGLSRWCSLLGGILVIFDNALLTQSRYILMESMLLYFSTFGLTMLLRFQKVRFPKPMWLYYGIMAACLLTCAICIKYAGFLTLFLGVYLLLQQKWDQIYDITISNLQLCLEVGVQFVMFTIIPLCIYLFVFYMHLQTLYRAGPHDIIMTSAFQASLDGGLASITKGQPLNVAHGSQITLRHSYGRTCWLHSHTQVYPVRYSDKRGSSHQQQVTCYSFKDVNNWWIVKRPEIDDLVVGDVPDVIRDGDIIQLVHGITSRALNSHDVAAPITPRCQEISCYIDYDINMKAELLWRVDILNKDMEGIVWHAIKSEVRLIHVATGAALRYTGQQLPDWGFNQHEVAGDRIIDSKDAIWNVEEHRYTKAHDERERERQLLKAEMIPTKPTKLTFLQKFIELKKKIFWHNQQTLTHMYSSAPLEWPLLTKGIAYWVDQKSNAQIHLLGNLLIWYTGSCAILLYTILGIFYILRRRRLHYDIDNKEWQSFVSFGHIHFIGYLLHYLPYFFMDRTLFLHHYLPAFLFKIHLLCYTIQHLDYLIKKYCCLPRITKIMWIVFVYRCFVLCWLFAVIMTYIRFLPISYGLKELSTTDLIQLRWKDTWDFVLQRDLTHNYASE